MWCSVDDLRAFYETPAGEAVVRALTPHLCNISLPAMSDCRVAAMGYMTPMLDRLPASWPRCTHLLPAALGKPDGLSAAQGRLACVEEDHLPLPDRSMDLLLMAHCLEMTAHPARTLRELWRVLADGGRLVVIAPSRVGLWARVESSPLAVGRPYSGGQLTRLLSDCLFEPGPVNRALYLPPGRGIGEKGLRSLQTAATWEQLGQRFWPRLGGLLVIEATKVMAAPVGPVSVRDTRQSAPAQAAPSSERRSTNTP